MNDTEHDQPKYRGGYVTDLMAQQLALFCIQSARDQLSVAWDNVTSPEFCRQVLKSADRWRELADDFLRERD